ncbi:transcription termination factor MTEF1, chloroplastic [Abrus precatorius]|uniref:Transcription termination factor MTEF1, chloroplastic n=1 Tax=Abrus precatorius TaxID=3816 RepID=A0A8B8KCN2_ABRPR|nr:transcription termination factor MTEF1, chloroplastic [Abrus precatorius]
MVSATMLLFSTDTHSLSLSPSPSPTIPKSFTRLCKPFHSSVPTSFPFHSTRPTFFVSATVIKWRCPKQTLPPNCDAGFQKKLLYLESVGIDSFSLIENHPMLITVSLADIKSTVEYITSMDFSAIEFRRMVGMCPEILTTQVSDIIPVFTFLHREVHVNCSDIRRVINRRPRLLVCSVCKQLRPTLYFLQSIGIEEVNKHTDLLSCSVEEKFMPRIDYFENIGFSRRDATSMFRRFPQLFCYSIKNNLEPKYHYFVVEMGRDLKELKEFPQYFSFSLENRIKPRHKMCVEMGVCFPLPVLLKASELRFRNRLDLCVNSSTPLKTSPLWCAGCDVEV